MSPWKLNVICDLQVAGEILETPWIIFFTQISVTHPHTLPSTTKAERWQMPGVLCPLSNLNFMDMNHPAVC